MRRQEAYQPVAAAYARNAKVAAAFLGGSTARGWADRYSDIEIGVVWREPPTDDDRRRAADASGAELHRLYPYDPEDEVWADVLFSGGAASGDYGSGVQIEIAHSTVESAERTLADVTQRYDPSELKQNFVSAVVHARPLHGETLIETWRARAIPYPRELGVAVVRRHAQIEFLWRTEMFLERGNNRMLVYESFSQIAKRLYHVLLGLNRIYFSGFKWIHRLTEEMQIAPPDFNRRIQRVFEVEPRAGAEALRVLAEEVYSLIEREMPEIDVERLRHFFRYERQPWDEPPTA